MNRVTKKGNLPPNPKNIIVDLPHGLGDQIMCFPLFASIKSAFPDASITALTPNPASTALLELNRNIDRTRTYPMKFTYGGALRFFLRDYLPLRRFFAENRFDLFLIVHPNPFRTLLSSLLPVKNILANREHAHKTREAKNILDEMGIPPVYDYSITPPDDGSFLENHGLSKGSYVLIDRYAQHLERDPRQWPHFDLLIDELLRMGHTPVLAGLNKRHEKRSDAVDLINETNLHQLLSLISDARLVISMDSGIFHFAYSLKIPVIGLFGPIDPEDRKPYDRSLEVHTLYTGERCSPCIINRVDIPCIDKNHERACMDDITPGRVLELAKKFL